MTRANFWRLGDPHPFAFEGKLFRAEGKLAVKPALCLGAKHDSELRAVDNLKLSRTNMAAATRAPHKPPIVGPPGAYC